MLPKPPFACDLSNEDEIAIFDDLKSRLAGVWDSLTDCDERTYTSVVIPSMTLDQRELRKLVGAPFYEERLLLLLIRLRNPRAHMVYVTSQPVHPMILEYYLNLLTGIPASHARARLTMLCAHDSTPRSLTEKILERPRLIQRIRWAIQDPARAYMTVFNSTPLERRLSVLLGVPLNGLDPKLCYLGTKSGSRKIFRQAGVDLPAGSEDLKGESDIVDALVDLREKRPAIRRAVIKLNESFSGEGNALFTFPDSRSRDAVHDALHAVSICAPDQTPRAYLDEFATMGGIVEEFIDAEETLSPSAQFRTSPSGDVVLISTHDQILGGPHGQLYLGCRFPASDDYRIGLQEAGTRVGHALAAHGVVSRFGVDFLAHRNRPGEWKLTALEINLRVVGTTHPFLALKFLSGGRLDAASGLFYSLGGRAKYYIATDNLKGESYRGLLPEDLVDILTVHQLHYDHRTESGVLFYLIGAMSEHGKLGMTAIANSHDEAQALYTHTLAVLDSETAIGRVTAPREPAPLE